MRHLLNLLTAIVIYAAVFATTIALGLVASPDEPVELDVHDWSCTALDPDDGQCAIYMRKP